MSRKNSRLYKTSCIICLTILLTACLGNSKEANGVLDNKAIEATLIFTESTAGQYYGELTLANHSPYDVNILKWLTGAGGIKDDILSVSYKGETLPYIGPRIKRAEPTKADYLSLDAGTAVTSKIELSKFYDLSKAGTYHINYEIQLMLGINYEVDMQDPPEAINSVSLISNVIDVNVD